MFCKYTAGKKLSICLHCVLFSKLHVLRKAEKFLNIWSVRVAVRLALPTSDHGVAGSNPAGGEILPESKRCFIAQSLSCSPFHRLEMTEILLKGRKTLTHPSILNIYYPSLVIGWSLMHLSMNSHRRSGEGWRGYMYCVKNTASENST